MVDLPIVNQHFKELSGKYPELSLIHWHGIWSVEGVLHFVATYEGQQIEDEYSIKISLPDEYPKLHPVVEETLGRIPRGFHYYQDGFLCLGTPYAVSRTFAEWPTLLGFTERCLIPYLYSFTYKLRYGRMPFGELSHGWLGILEFYSDEFGVNDQKAVIRLLRILAEGCQNSLAECPCGSKKRISACHGKKLKQMLRIQPASFFRQQYLLLINGIPPDNILPILNLGYGSGRKLQVRN